MQKMESEAEELKLAIATVTNVYRRDEIQVKGSHCAAVGSASVINKRTESGVQLSSADFMNEHRNWADEPTTDSSSCADQIESADQNECRLLKIKANFFSRDL